MCSGGGGGGGTITMPDTDAYDRQLDRQLQAMQSQYDGQMQLAQGRLNSALREQAKVLGELEDYRTQRAEEVASVEAEARRMANIVGPPPPEESAKAPVVGRDRFSGSGLKGKRALRIARSGQAYKSGAGLNIT